MLFDPIYFVFIIPGVALSLLASWRVKVNFKKYSQVQSSCGLSGAQAATELLRREGIQGVEVIKTAGRLSDHYNPITKKLALQ